jgi:hypothetical protein
MKNKITAYFGIESLTIKQIIDIIIKSEEFSAMPPEEVYKILLDRRPVELLLMMKG